MKSKRFFEALPVVAALLLTASCSNENNEMIISQPEEAPAVKTIPFTANVGTAVSTRATLNSDMDSYEFEEGDRLWVEDAEKTLYGWLLISDTDAGKSSDATFAGDLSYTGEGTPSAELVLTGTLVSVSASDDDADFFSFDAEGNLTGYSYPVTAITDTPEEAVQKYSLFTAESTFGEKDFSLEQQSSFLSFEVTLVDGTDTENSLDVSIYNNSSEVRTGSVTPTSVDSKVKAMFVAAFPDGTELNGATVQLASKPVIGFGGSTTLAANNFYQINKGIVELSSLDGDYTAKNGDVLYGEFGGDYNVKIADGAKVTLQGVTVELNAEVDKPAIQCLGDATIILEGENIVTGSIIIEGEKAYPGIFVDEGKTLTIQGDGELTVQGGTFYESGEYYDAAAGIGGLGNIVIKSGIINATGFVGAAGIGGSVAYPCGDILISGGEIHAESLGEEMSSGAGIGCASSGICGNITISGGIVYAKGGFYGAGIGGGEDSECGDITISGGTVVAEGGEESSGIGTGRTGVCGTITFSGGDVTAIAGPGAPAAIGIGDSGSCPEVSIVSGVEKMTMTNDNDYISDNPPAAAFINATAFTVQGTDYASYLNTPVTTVNWGLTMTGKFSSATYESKTWTLVK